MLVDPNIVYLILLAALWLSVTAVYVPGTGIIEVFAVGGLIGAIALLTQLPTNWLAVLLLVVGVLGFLVMPLIEKRLALVSVTGLILQAIGSLTLYSNGVSVALPLIAITVGAALLYHRYALLRVLESHKQKPAMLDDEPIIGAVGYVQKAIDPVGTVYVRGESWTARADMPLPTGTAIAVVEQDGLTLFVEAVKQKHHQPLEEI